MGWRMPRVITGEKSRHCALTDSLGKGLLPPLDVEGFVAGTASMEIISMC